MASEAEIERLYQLFVAKGGGAGTFDNANLTPLQYSESQTTWKLTPLQLAQLESKQHQYNKQSALRTIADEIDANNFTNPYATRGAYSSGLFTGLGSSAGVSTLGAISTALAGFNTGDKSAIFAGVLAASGVNLEQILKIGGLMALGTSMFSSLTNHTNNQTANIPQTMADASSLASMNAQFGEAGNPCDQFNQLMGLLGGVFDGTLDVIDSTVTAIHGFLKQTGVLDLLSNILSAIGGAVQGIATVVAAVIGALVGAGVAILNTLSPLVEKVMNAMDDITSQIATELAGFADMASALLRKALALVLGSSALDPCQSAVLMNTGTISMKDAVTLLKHPMGTGAPGGIGTTVDTRANPDEVKQQMKYSRDEAKLNPGVVQNPITESAKKYIPKDDVLHTSTKSDFSKVPIVSAAFTEGQARWKPKQLAYKQSRGTLLQDIFKKIVVGNWIGKEAEWHRINDLYTQLGNNTRAFGKRLFDDRVKRGWSYTTSDGKVNKGLEENWKIKWETKQEPVIKRKFERANENLVNTKRVWAIIEARVDDIPEKVASFGDGTLQGQNDGLDGLI